MDNDIQFLETVEREGFDYAVMNYGTLLEESDWSGEYYDYLEAREALVSKFNNAIRDDIRFSQFEEIV